jgi:hypothetical protein
LSLFGFDVSLALGSAAAAAAVDMDFSNGCPSDGKFIVSLFSFPSTLFNFFICGLFYSLMVIPVVRKSFQAFTGKSMTVQNWY